MDDSDFEATNPVKSESAPENVASPQQKVEEATSTTLSTSDDASQIKRRKQTLTIIGLQIFLAVLMVLVGLTYNRSHSTMGWFNFILSGDGGVTFNEKVSAFNFIGVNADNPEPSFWAVMFEVLAWSFFGILARTEYNLTQTAVRRKKFVFLEVVSKIIGDHAMGGAIAMAVVAFLRSTSLNVGNVNLTLGSADIEFIIAISFILGFYHEDTRRLLGSFQKNITRAVNNSGKSEGTE